MERRRCDVLATGANDFALSEMRRDIIAPTGAKARFDVRGQSVSEREGELARESRESGGTRGNHSLDRR